jgi:hypothetical protein
VEQAEQKPWDEEAELVRALTNSSLSTTSTPGYLSPTSKLEGIPVHETHATDSAAQLRASHPSHGVVTCATTLLSIAAAPLRLSEGYIWLPDYVPHDAAASTCSPPAPYSADAIEEIQCTFGDRSSAYEADAEESEDSLPPVGMRKRKKINGEAKRPRVGKSRVRWG